MNILEALSTGLPYKLVDVNEWTTPGNGRLIYESDIAHGTWEVKKESITIERLNIVFSRLEETVEVINTHGDWQLAWKVFKKELGL